MRYLNVKMANGDVVSAPFEEWVAALLFSMPAEQLTRVVERLQQIKTDNRGSWQTLPGSVLAQIPKHTIMKAEPGVIGVRR